MEQISGPGVVVAKQKNVPMMIMILTECLTPWLPAATATRRLVG